MNLQDEQHQSNSLSDQNNENAQAELNKSPKKRKPPSKLNHAERKAIEDRNRVLSLATKRAEFTRNVPKVYPAIDDHYLEITALRARAKIQRLRAVAGGDA